MPDSKARLLAKLLDASGDVVSSGLDNVPASDDASALTTGTLPAARIASGAITAAKLETTLNLSSKTVTLPAASVTAHATNPTKTSIEALAIDLPAANLTGTIADARISHGTTANKFVRLTASGKLPAIDGADLTNLPASNNVKNVAQGNIGWARVGGNTYENSGTFSYTPVSSSGLLLIQVRCRGTGHLWGSTDQDVVYAVNLYNTINSQSLQTCKNYYEYGNNRIDGGGDLAHWTSGPHLYDMHFYMQHAATHNGTTQTWTVRMAKAAPSVFDIDSSHFIITEI